MAAPVPALHAVADGAIDRLEGRRLLVLLHGLGADERDLLPLGGELDLDDAVVSLRAPLPWGPGFAWAEVREDPTRRTGSMRPGAEAVLAWLDSAAEALGRPDEVRLLGFSQGGALALTLLRLEPRRFSAAVVLAGFLPEDEEDDAALEAVRPPVFWGRGDADPVIPAAAVARTTAWLPGRSRLTERVYPGLTHGISAEELADAGRFLREA